ncbi:MAG: carotenoid biosynthesis protein [Verrucomicrobia bacterium]|nr:carotenoid biosynthesis protein [Cytophagales bacterium]
MLPVKFPLIDKKHFPILLLMTAMYITGLIGLNLADSRAIFRWFVPWHLLANAVLLLYFHEDWNRHFFIFCVVTYLTGFLVEWAGVETGVIFGKYWYGNTLGLKLAGIPLMIGVNWLVLVYITGVLCEPLKVHFLFKAILAASLMTGLDFLIEPVAMKHDFWQWENSVVPFRNFVGWWLTALLLQVLFQKLTFEKKNPFAWWVFGLQILFFASQWLF